MSDRSAISQPVLIQAVGRGLYQLGSAILLFYMPIVFVNYAGLTATQVGLAVGGGSIAGFIGNFVGGAMTDSAQLGRKGTLIGASLLSITAALITAFAPTLPLLLVANVFFGVGTGLYWTAADAAVMDVTTSEERQSAFSILAVLDNIGLGLGTLGGAWLLKTIHPENRMFTIAAAVFGLMLLLFTIGVRETRDLATEHESVDGLTGWKTAVTDSRLITYLIVNTLFITYIALVNSNLPLYLINFQHIAEGSVSNLFTFGYVGLGALLQVPVIKLISSFSYIKSLMISTAIWGLGFTLLALWHPIDGALIAALTTLIVFAIATVIYKPTSAAWIAELSPPSLRGAYTAIAYQCWAIGYFIGPIFGGWALDQPANITHTFWLMVGSSSIVGLIVLQILNQRQTKAIAAMEAE
ncbi:MFS transporter [filamentous cyanobacterium LEGE 11480]|uniref:MFS transporter n=1 Tax=Romeriopsis navalis LEGE 11480 TaxID=2777977 RepID=A0A928Z625_9CYAN|nr:MFS transporter [Romeriopsis navalis]MBE9033379.1 MFS transporter [Romeriopsis navalis LEGE 11480]